MGVEEYLRGVLPMEVYPSWPQAILQAQAVAARSWALASKGKHKAEGFDFCSTSHCQNFNPAIHHIATDKAIEATKGIVGVYQGKIAAMFYSASCGGQTENEWGDYMLKRTDCPCASGLKPHARYGHGHGLCQWGGKYLANKGETWEEILDFYYDLNYVGDYNQQVIPPATVEVRLAEIEARQITFAATIAGQDMSISSAHNAISDTNRAVGEIQSETNARLGGLENRIATLESVRANQGRQIDSCALSLTDLAARVSDLEQIYRTDYGLDRIQASIENLEQLTKGMTRGVVTLIGTREDLR